jgi:predicted amidohydrolase
MQIAIAQLNQVLGDLAANSEAILASVAAAERAGARFVVTPELSLCGYPPEDLVLRPAFLDACARELKALAGAVGRIPVAVGFPERDGGVRYNSLALLAEGRVKAVYRKQMLPNYRVFDEERYFEPGTTPCVVDIDGLAVGFIICEDVWFAGPAKQAKEAGAQVIVVANGSPYHTSQQHGATRPGRRTRARDRPSVRVRESRRRAGRARVRRRLVRDERGRRRRPAIAVMARNGGARDARRGRRSAAGAWRARSAARVSRLPGAGDGRARLRDQEPVPRRAARPVRRRRFRARARGRGRRARPRAASTP